MDDEELAAVGVNETASVEVAPGKHTVMVKMDWTTSPSLSVVVDGDEDIHVDVDAGLVAATLKTFVQPRRVWRVRQR